MADLILVRHGETEWSRSGRHTGRTDVPLTEHGREEARRLAPVLRQLRVAAAFASPRQRAQETAELIGLTGVRTDWDLQEWDYGGYEGVTTAQILRERPHWFLFTDGVVPGPADRPGESPEQVGERADRMLATAEAAGAGEEEVVVLVSHGHFLRVLTARWLGLPASSGALFQLGTGTLCRLGTEHGRPVIAQWNVRPPA
ncbi:histidine phosphatase family protein [Streptomyces thermodiastaticus]|jgi:probable phosphoglycerate mutase|uniref:histidine phosphatase family protein n=1 Tax=Streptomyces thermodiastaticus TaxID=44061 RepID=UPI00167782D9|nr:histidine phosphatase family protein [Streptomyces thermodiastaticus]MCE7549113.1 histidine phosphatase family protein [Streptomyces thermodiastaticus]GHF60231.1 phosphatase [Streptomyces thermodiastaticus]